MAYNDVQTLTNTSAPLNRFVSSVLQSSTPRNLQLSPFFAALCSGSERGGRSLLCVMSSPLCIFGRVMYCGGIYRAVSALRGAPHWRECLCRLYVTIRSKDVTTRDGKCFFYS